MTEQGKVKRKPTLAESLMAVLFLIIIIVVGNVFFGLSVELMFVVAIFFLEKFFDTVNHDKLLSIL